MSNVCLQCLRGTCVVHSTDGPLSENISGGTEGEEEQDEGLSGAGDDSGDEEEDRYSKNAVSRGVRRYKPDSAVTDQQSTGRKRAAKLYPLDKDAPCEWLGKVLQGGGDHPIQGCFIWEQQDGKCKQLNRHHGPDKNTLNNDPGNVHRIGPRCHNRWHAKNDPDYDPNKKLRD